MSCWLSKAVYCIYTLIHFLSFLTCTLPPIRRYALLNDECVECEVENCVACNGDAGACSACMSFYGLIDGSCQRCSVPACLKCDGNTASCLECQDGWNWDAASGQCKFQ